jgi:hypothetical protein
LREYNTLVQTTVLVFVSCFHLCTCFCRSDGDIDVSCKNKTHNHTEKLNTANADVERTKRLKYIYTDLADANAPDKTPTLGTKHHHSTPRTTSPSLYPFIPHLKPPLPTPINHQLLTHSPQPPKRPTSLNTPLSVQSR